MKAERRGNGHGFRMPHEAARGMQWGASPLAKFHRENGVMPFSRWPRGTRGQLAAGLSHATHTGKESENHGRGKLFSCFSCGTIRLRNISANKNGCGCIRSCISKKIERHGKPRREKHGGGLWCAELPTG
jgi:hypothetical protein